MKKQKLLAKAVEIENERELLFEELKQFTSEELNRKPSPGKWSVLQVLQHLMAAESLSQSYIRKKSSGAKARIPKAGFPAFFRLSVLKFAFSLPLKYKAPSYTSEFPENSLPDDILKRYKAITRDWKTLLEELPEDLMDKAIYKHPIAGKFNMEQALDFADTHYSHHLKQIRALVNSFNPLA